MSKNIKFKYLPGNNHISIYINYDIWRGIESPYKEYKICSRPDCIPESATRPGRYYIREKDSEYLKEYYYLEYEDIWIDLSTKIRYDLQDHKPLTESEYIDISNKISNDNDRYDKCKYDNDDFVSRDFVNSYTNLEMYLYEKHNKANDDRQYKQHSSRWRRFHNKKLWAKVKSESKDDDSDRGMSDSEIKKYRIEFGKLYKR